MNRCTNRAIPHPEDLDQLAQAQTLFEQNGQDGLAAGARGLIAILSFVFLGYDAAFCDDLRDAISRLQRAGIHTHARGFTYQLCAMIANRGRLDEASTLIEQSAAECREMRDDYHLSQFLYLHAHIQMERLAFAQALALMQEAERVAHQALDPRREMLARTLVAENLRFLGDPARAANMAAECVFYAQHTMGDLHDEVPIYVLTKALTDCARFDEAHAQIHGLLTRLDKARGAVASLYFNGFDAMARNASGAGRAAEAAYLFGAADGDLERSKQRRFSQNDLECAPLIARAKEALGDADYQRHYAAGRTAELAQAIQFALTHWQLRD